MNDLDRLLKESLNAVRDSYAEERQEDRFEMRARFIERYRRRRAIFTTGSFALAGAALIAGVMLFSGNLDMFADRSPDSELAGKPQKGVLAAIPTGEEPVDIAIRFDGVFVANAGNNTITHIDPEESRIAGTIDLDGMPQEVDVGEGGIWVAGYGSVSKFNTQTEQLIESVPVGEADSTITLSIGEGAVWVVVDETRLVRVDPESFTAEDVPGPTFPVDVAARDGSVWVLDAEQGLLQLDPVTLEAKGEPLPDVGRGDVSGGGGLIWIGNAEDDTVTRLDAATGRFKGNFQVDGTYLDLAVSETHLWVLSKPNGHALLTAINPVTRRPIGVPLKLEGDPVEVSSGGGGVWVAARSAGVVYRIDQAAVAP